MAGDRARRIDPDPGADGHREDAGGVSVGDRPADVLAGCRRSTGAAASCTSRRSRRWRWTWSATCNRRWWGSRRRRGRGGEEFHEPSVSDPDGRYSARGTRAVCAASGRYPDHHAGIDLPDADLERARDAAFGGDGDRGRDSRAGADQARVAPGALAGTAGGVVRTAAAAHRAFGDTAAARRGRAVSGRRGGRAGRAQGSQGGRHRAGDSGRVRSGRCRAAISRRDDRGRGRAEAAGAARGSADRGHGAAGRDRRAAERPGIAGAGAAFDLERDSSQAAGTGAGAHVRRYLS